MAENCPESPQPGLGRDHQKAATAGPSQEWQGIAPRALSQDGRRSTTTTKSGPQPGVAGYHTQGPWPGLARDHPPQAAANPCQEWRGTAPRALSQEWRGTTHKNRRQTPARSGGELHQRPPARIGEGLPNTTSSRPQPGMAGTAPKAFSQDWRGLAHNTHTPHAHQHKHARHHRRDNNHHTTTHQRTRHTPRTRTKHKPPLHAGKNTHHHQEQPGKAGKPQSGPAAWIGEGPTTGLVPTPAASPSRQRQGQTAEDPQATHHAHTRTYTTTHPHNPYAGTTSTENALNDEPTTGRAPHAPIRGTDTHDAGKPLPIPTKTSTQTSVRNGEEPSTEPQQQTPPRKDGQRLPRTSARIDEEPPNTENDKHHRDRLPHQPTTPARPSARSGEVPRPEPATDRQHAGPQPDPRQGRHRKERPGWTGARP